MMYEHVGTSRAATCNIRYTSETIRRVTIRYNITQLYKRFVQAKTYVNGQLEPCIMSSLGRLIRLPDKGSPPISVPPRPLNANLHLLPLCFPPTIPDSTTRGLESKASRAVFISVSTSTSASLKDTQLYLC